MSLRDDLDRIARTAIDGGRIVGSVVIVCHRGASIYQAAHGWADRENGRPMNIDTMFRLSSLTKPIIAACILAQVKCGLLHLDHAVSDFFPAFTPCMPDGSMPPITVRHLLTHTSGLGLDVSRLASDGQDPGRIEMAYYHRSLEQVVRLHGGSTLRFTPGTAWAYSRSYDVLGAIAALLADDTLEGAVEKFVTRPLGMRDTGFRVTDRSRLATAYADGATQPVRMRDPHVLPDPWGGQTIFHPDRIFDGQAFLSGSDGMIGTASDYMLLLESLWRGRTPFGKSGAAEALSNQTPHLPHAVAPGWQFCLIGAWLDHPALAGSPASAGTARWGGIFGHSWFIDQVAQLSVVSMTNTGLEGSDGLFPNEIRDAVYKNLRIRDA